MIEVTYESTGGEGGPQINMFSIDSDARIWNAAIATRFTHDLHRRKIRRRGLEASSMPSPVPVASIDFFDWYGAVRPSR